MGSRIRIMSPYRRKRRLRPPLADERALLWGMPHTVAREMRCQFHHPCGKPPGPPDFSGINHRSQGSFPGKRECWILHVRCGELSPTSAPHHEIPVTHPRPWARPCHQFLPLLDPARSQYHETERTLPAGKCSTGTCFRSAPYDHLAISTLPSGKKPASCEMPEPRLKRQFRTVAF